jgi:TolB protein
MAGTRSTLRTAATGMMLMLALTGTASAEPFAGPSGTIAVVQLTVYADAYSSSSEAKLRVVDPRTGQESALLDEPFVSMAASWSPDGREFVVSSNDGLFRYGPGGRKQLTAPVPHEPDGSPAWSPDGRWIAYVHAVHGPMFPQYATCLIRLVSPDGKTSRDLANGGTGYCGGLSWAPTSQTLVYSSASFPTGKPLAQLMAVSMTGGDPVALTTTAGDHLSPAWSPDGGTIAFYAPNWSAHGSIMALDVASGAERVVVQEVVRIVVELGRRSPGLMVRR